MRLDPNETIAGVTNRQIRDFLRSCGSYVSARYLASRLKLSDDRAEALIRALTERGLLRDEGVVDGTATYALTSEAGAWGSAKFTKPITRARADELVKGVVARAERINGDPDLTHYVAEMRMFGSYITDATSLGDVDLEVRFEKRPGLGDVVLASQARAGNRSLNFVDRLLFGRREVTQILKDRKPHISLHDWGEVEQLGCAFKHLFTADLQKVAPSAVTYEK